MSNFDFLKDEFIDLYELCLEAEKNCYIKPRTSAFYSRLALEFCVALVYKFENIQRPYNSTVLNDFINNKDTGVVNFWQKLGISGWRLDVADEFPDEFLDRIRETAKYYDKDALIIGEVWEVATNKISYNTRRRYFLGKQLDSVMNYPWKNAIIEFIKQKMLQH